MCRISPLSAVDPKAVIADDVEIGPFCVIGPHVTLGPGNRLLSHVVIDGHTTIGRNNLFHPHCAIGGLPQDLKYRGGATKLEIGDHNDIREAVTIHIGTEVGGGVTRVGNHNLLMINCHVAHDVQIADHCILANNVCLAGHVVCGNGVNMMGMVGIHHFVTVGDFAYLGGMARIRHDVPPFVKVDGADHVRGLNKEGLRRAHFTDTDIDALEIACRRLFARQAPLAVAMAALGADRAINPHVAKLLEFLQRRNLGKHGRYLESRRPPESLAPSLQE
jgi:UDP-N-acetylglucosamine acyltransferase